MSSTTTPVPAPLSAAEFNVLSRTQRIQIVAEDALARFHAGQVTPTSNVLVRIAIDLVAAYGIDAQAHMLAGRACEACALGAAALSIAAIEDRMAFGYDPEKREYRLGIDDDWCKTEPTAGVHTRLKELFGTELVITIETAFEGENGAFCFETTPEQRAAGVAFSTLYPTVQARFLAIYTQLARTGTFKL